MTEKKVKLDLTKVDGNAFALMGAFLEAASAQGWLSCSIDAVIAKCMSGDYDNLVATLNSVCES